MTVHACTAEETNAAVMIIPSLLISNCDHVHKLVSVLSGEMHRYPTNSWYLIFYPTPAVAHMAHSSSFMYSFSVL